ncbi:hypothetical protein G6F68_018466 [Rhizopus microsporus]|uniref:Uncharacterized protein n=1 Tax=Rhizopus delemar TaxID=936053 RepID=A0A9P7C0F5_9FUNG|nr:hypothetical protein G6F31_018306 [Rhizopus arrhizus]KAG1239611.1 hypothetical protein G6F68_018466 [Rhizopus microsporus]KAG1529877.1 hypothetical protein G6F50_017696 [Rhizopus delemar]
MGQEAGVGVQHHVVVVVGNRAQHLAFGRCGVRQQLEGLIAVAGEDHFVVMRLAVGRGDHHACRLAHDLVHRAIQALKHVPPLAHGTDIGA